MPNAILSRNGIGIGGKIYTALQVFYPIGSLCVATFNNRKHTAPNRSGVWTLFVPGKGDYSLESTYTTPNGALLRDSNVINVSRQLPYVINLLYRRILVNPDGKYDGITGKWTGHAKRLTAGSTPTFTVTCNYPMDSTNFALYMKLTKSSEATRNGYVSCANKFDLTNIKSVYIRGTQSSASSSHYVVAFSIWENSVGTLLADNRVVNVTFPGGEMIVDFDEIGFSPKPQTNYEIGFSLGANTSHSATATIYEMTLNYRTEENV